MTHWNPWGLTGTHGDTLRSIGTHMGKYSLDLTQPNITHLGGHYVSTYIHGDTLGPMETHWVPLGPTCGESSFDLM